MYGWWPLIEEAFPNKTISPHNIPEIKEINNIRNHGLDFNNYTKESWKQFEKALNEMNNAIKFSNSEEEIIQTINNLKLAKKNLVTVEAEIIMKTKELQILIDSLEDFDEKQYTAESWSALIKAKEAAVSAVNDESSDLQTLLSAYTSLEQKIKDLKKIEAVDEDEKPVVDEPKDDSVDKDIIQEDKGKGSLPPAGMSPTSFTAMVGILLTSIGVIISLIKYKEN